MIIEFRGILSAAFNRDVEEEFDSGLIDIINLRFAELTAST